MTSDQRKLYNRLATIQRKISEIDSDYISTELESLIANANAAIQLAMDAIKK